MAHIHTTKGQPCFLEMECVIEFLKWYISCSQREVRPVSLKYSLKKLISGRQLFLLPKIFAVALIIS